MTEGTIATIRVQIYKNATSFQLLLLHDAPEFDMNVGATVLLIDVDYLKDEINLKSFSKLLTKKYEKIFKHELGHLPFYGSSICLQGQVLSSSIVKGNVEFDISMLHESNDYSKKCRFK
uniref:Uncharacterized protein n=1 Tax=Meloidogyne hapla TaxID=6305 RepID=A0A1I8B9X1_MELHA